MAYNFAINQPLFHWGALRDGSRIGELQQKIAQGQTGEAYRLLVDEIRAQYLQVIMTKAAVARARFGLKIAEDQLALARTKLEKRFISEGDLFGPTISAEQARLASDRAAEDYENSRTYLSKLCGTPILSDDQIPSEVPAVTPASSDLQAVVSEFANHGDVDTYALRIARDQIAVEELNYKIADTRLKPKANLNFGTSQDEQNYSLNSVRYKVQSYYAGFVVNWSIFDGFATRAVKTASLARRRQLEETYKIQTADTIAAVRSQLRQVEFSARSLALSERLLGSAGDMLNAKKEDMSRGVASDTDVSLAQLGVYDSQLAAYAARNDYLLRVSRVLSATMKDPALANLSLSRR
jgi:outer membrane protein TolC